MHHCICDKDCSLPIWGFIASAIPAWKRTVFVGQIEHFGFGFGFRSLVLKLLAHCFRFHNSFSPSSTHFLLDWRPVPDWFWETNYRKIVIWRKATYPFVSEATLFHLYVMDQGKENNSSCSGYHQCFIFFAFSDLLEKDDFVFATFGFYLQRQTHTGGNLSFDYFFLCSFDEYFCVGGFFQWQLNPGKSPFQRTYANQVTSPNILCFWQYWLFSKAASVLEFSFLLQYFFLASRNTETLGM